MLPEQVHRGVAGRIGQNAPLPDPESTHISAFPTCQVEPPLTGHPGASCVGPQTEDPVGNQFTPLSGSAARHHRRMALRGSDANQTEQRDSLVFPLPRRFRIPGVVIPSEAELEFGYRVGLCRGAAAPGEVVAVVRLVPEVGAPTVLVIPLDARRPRRRSGPWHEVRRALPAPAGRSLLPIGVIAAEGDFRKGDVIALSDLDGKEFARGLTNYSGREIRRIQGLKTDQIAAALGHCPYDEVIHRNNMVLTT